MWFVWGQISLLNGCADFMTRLAGAPTVEPCALMTHILGVSLGPSFWHTTSRFFSFAQMSLYCVGVELTFQKWFCFLGGLCTDYMMSMPLCLKQKLILLIYLTWSLFSWKPGQSPNLQMLQVQKILICDSCVRYRM